VERLANHAATYGIPNVSVDGNDLLAVRSAAAEAIERGRRGDGPTFIEALTYRLRGHYEGDPGAYRDQAELAAWREKDPIERLARRLEADGLMGPDPAVATAERARARMAAVAEAVLALPAAGPADLTTDVVA
jgi:pyruvate dehydrogenase E1 component alpha subunit